MRMMISLIAYSVYSVCRWGACLFIESRETTETTTSPRDQRRSWRRVMYDTQCCLSPPPSVYMLCIMAHSSVSLGISVMHSTQRCIPVAYIWLAALCLCKEMNAIHHHSIAIDPSISLQFRGWTNGTNVSIGLLLYCMKQTNAFNIGYSYARVIPKMFFIGLCQKIDCIGPFSWLCLLQKSGSFACVMQIYLSLQVSTCRDKAAWPFFTSSVSVVWVANLPDFFS